MNYQDKTKDELVLELQKLQLEYASLKTSYSKDITGLKQIEELLNESIERLNEAQKLAHIGVWDWKPNTDTVNWTNELYYIAGLDPILSAPTFKEQCSLYTPKSWELLKISVEKALEAGESYQLELELIRPDGDIRIVNAFGGAQFDSKGQVNGLFGTVQDITERKLAEKALRESEELFRIVISNAPISIFATNDRGIFILHAGKALEKVGMKSGQNVGSSAYNLFSDLKVVEHNGNTIMGKQVLDRVLHGEKLSGITELNDVIFDNQFVPITDMNGQVTGLIGVATDITISRKAKDALIESEAKFRSIFENSLMGISIAHPGGGFLQVNNAYARMYGYENPELFLAEVHDTRILFANPEERKEVLRELQIKGFIEPREFELIRRDGSHFFVLVSACEIRDSDGKLLYNQATHIDLTERKKIEKEIHDASLYARNLIEASLDPLVTISINGKITDVNRATEEITGIKRENLIGTDFADYFTEPDKAKKGYKTVFSKGEVKDYPLSILNKNGRKIDVLYNATLFKNEADEVQGLFAAARDITDRKKMEADLRNSKKTLEKLNQHLNEVRESERAAISREIHDLLGQSLTALKIDLNWLSGKTDAESEEGIKLNEMIELVNATSMDIHRISSELRPAMFDDLGLAAALEWYCEEFANRTGLKVQMEIEDIQTENTNRDLSIYRVTQESLTNIIRHAGAKKVQIKLRKRKKNIVLSIEDDGIGISSDKIRSTKSFGLLGMFERVNQSGGHMDITAPVTGGTRVRVYMPIG